MSPDFDSQAREFLTKEPTKQQASDLIDNIERVYHGVHMLSNDYADGANFTFSPNFREEVDALVFTGRKVHPINTSSLVVRGAVFLRTILVTYPEYADVLFREYKGVFNSTHDQQRSRSCAVTNDDVQGFANHYERVILAIPLIHQRFGEMPSSYGALEDRARAIGTTIR